MIEAVALRGTLTLWYQGRKVNISLAELKLADVLAYIERKTGKQIQLIAGQLGR